MLLSLWYFIPIFRVEKTQFSDSSLVATVKRFSKPTLQEEVEGRTEYEVSIKQKVQTRSRKQLSDFYQFNHACECKSVKSTCIHIAFLLVSEFCEPEEN